MITANTEFLSVIDKKADKLKADIICAKDCDLDIKGKTYYVSNNGCDLNDGLSPRTAIKTLDRIHTLPLEEGDGILLERGCEWRGNGVILRVNNITLGAYGEGA